jgi:hypothetical protein
MEEGGFSKCLNPTAWVRALCCNSVYITCYCSMQIPVSICTSYFMANKQALVDSGATDNFMHPVFTTKMGLGMRELPMPRKIFNIDNTTNKSGKITHYLDLDVCTKGVTFFLLTSPHSSRGLPLGPSFPSSSHPLHVQLVGSLISAYLPDLSRTGPR